MSLLDTGRLIIAAFITSVVTFRFIACNRDGSDRGKERWRPVFDPLYLATIVPMVFAASLLLDTVMLQNVGSSLAEVVLTTAVYFALLLPVLPLLRRHFSTRACAMLWLLPNVLYFVFYEHMNHSEPLFVLPIRVSFGWLLWVWLGGTVLVLAWKLAEHIRFRRALLRNAHAPDEETLTVFQGVREEMEEESALKEPLPLLLSPQTSTPLSIGLTRKTLRVMLPERNYTPDELRLIFRHELIHIARRDAGTKLFLVLCTAVMWFNPLMWIAMRRCADDLELGCDEFVLLDEPEDARSLYAGLLLKTAGDERGFTTCLSATAEALRYRLENILRPKKKLLGGLLLGLVTLSLIAFSGTIAFAFAPQRLDEAISLGAEEIEWYYYPDSDYTVPASDGAPIWEVLRGCEVYRLSGNYRPDADFWFHGNTDGKSIELHCSGHYVFVEIRLYEKGKGYGRDLLKSCFVFTEEPDWDALLAKNAG
ncbi:MAG: M56 family metallopeptidase [Oscillospiraceae bacterium]|nr:M56 family metallopeptidase [Oscillospiraceae bacterium]